MIFLRELEENYADDYKSYLRMDLQDSKMFEFISHKIEKQNTLMEITITPEEKLFFYLFNVIFNTN